MRVGGHVLAVIAVVALMLSPHYRMAGVFVPQPLGRSPDNPLIESGPAWEEGAVFEPAVLYEGGVFKMWYTGGWSSSAIGYATSTDGIIWSKYESNPVLGQGGSGISGYAARPCIFKDGSTYYLYYADANPDANLRVATSSDGIIWSAAGTALASNAASWASGWANCSVWKEGATWHMLVEGRNTPIWEITRATSSDGLSWTLVNSGARLTDLQVSLGGMYGGPHQPYEGAVAGVYHLYFHAAWQGGGVGSGQIPTAIYHATSADLDSWTVDSVPILKPAWVGYEYDQVADPWYLIANGVRYLYYDGVDNDASEAAIGVATASL